jgi:hypothetical protein
MSSSSDFFKMYTGGGESALLDELVSLKNTLGNGCDFSLLNNLILAEHKKVLREDHSYSNLEVCNHLFEILTPKLRDVSENTLSSNNQKNPSKKKRSNQKSPQIKQEPVTFLDPVLPQVRPISTTEAIVIYNASLFAWRSGALELAFLRLRSVFSGNFEAVDDYVSLKLLYLFIEVCIDFRQLVAASEILEFMKNTSDLPLSGPFCGLLVSPEKANCSLFGQHECSFENLNEAKVSCFEFKALDLYYKARIQLARGDYRRCIEYSKISMMYINQEISFLETCETCLLQDKHEKRFTFYTDLLGGLVSFCSLKIGQNFSPGLPFLGCKQDASLLNNLSFLQYSENMKNLSEFGFKKVLTVGFSGEAIHNVGLFELFSSDSNSKKSFSMAVSDPKFTCDPLTWHRLGESSLLETSGEDQLDEAELNFTQCLNLINQHKNFRVFDNVKNFSEKEIDPISGNNSINSLDKFSENMSQVLNYTNLNLAFLYLSKDDCNLALQSAGAVLERSRVLPEFSLTRGEIFRRQTGKVYEISLEMLKPTETDQIVFAAIYASEALCGLGFPEIGLQLLENVFNEPIFDADEKATLFDEKSVVFSNERHFAQ